MVPDQKIMVKWRRDNYKHYVSKGYSFSDFGAKLEVDAKDLSKGSRVIIEYICDYCNGSLQKNKFIENKLLLDHRKNNDKDCCGDKKCIKVKKSESLSKVSFNESLMNKSPHLIKEWHPTKNIDILPSEIANGSHRKVWWKCSDCDCSWEAAIKSRTLLNSGCPFCKHKPSVEDSLGFNFPELCKELHPTKNNRFDPFVVHYGTSESVWWKCLICNNEWKTQIKSRTKIKTGCPGCVESKGEKRIRGFLNKYEINFASQQTFKGLLGKKGRPLSYDFYLPKYNTLIEYQGEFHDANGGNGNYFMKENLEKQQEHDKRKREYAEQNRICLLEIWYWDFDNIEDILADKLIKLNINDCPALEQKYCDYLIFYRKHVDTNKII